MNKGGISHRLAQRSLFPISDTLGFDQSLLTSLARTSLSLEPPSPAILPVRRHHRPVAATLPSPPCSSPVGSPPRSSPRAAASRSVAERREAPLLWLRHLLRPACRIHAVVLACTRQVLRLFLPSGQIRGARSLTLARNPQPWLGFRAGHRLRRRRGSVGLRRLLSVSFLAPTRGSTSRWPWGWPAAAPPSLPPCRGRSRRTEQRR
mgnify:CR=1 FL=1